MSPARLCAAASNQPRQRHLPAGERLHPAVHARSGLDVSQLLRPELKYAARNPAENSKHQVCSETSSEPDQQCRCPTQPRTACATGSHCQYVETLVEAVRRRLCLFIMYIGIFVMLFNVIFIFLGNTLSECFTKEACYRD